MVKQAKKVNKIREAAKRSKEFPNLLKKVNKIFLLAKERSTKYFSKVDTINLVQFLVRQVQCNPARSDVLSSAHPG